MAVTDPDPVYVYPLAPSTIHICDLPAAILTLPEDVFNVPPIAVTVSLPSILINLFPLTKYAFPSNTTPLLRHGPGPADPSNNNPGVGCNVILALDVSL